MADRKTPVLPMRVFWGLFLAMGAAMFAASLTGSWQNLIGLVPVALLLLMLVHAVFAFRKPQVDLAFFCSLGIFGVALFLLVWETANHYIYPYLLLLLPPALDGLQVMDDGARNRLRRRTSYDKI